ncbi:MAG: YdcF family protein [Thermodesulfobacteriota bacterium]
MFIVKKIITAFVLPPGLIILALLIVGGRLIRKKQSRAAGGLVLFLGLLLWAASVSPVSDHLVRGLEEGQAIPRQVGGDVIILLGGANIDEALDMTGKGFPGGDTLARMVTAVRLQRRLDIPVLIASGRVFPDRMAGALVVKRLMMDLGVPAERIFLEEKSRDTLENAFYSIEICREHGWREPVLLTSSAHMKRSVMLFERYGLKTTPYPAYLVAGEPVVHRWRDYLPRADALAETAAALHEYLGIVYYRLVHRS